MSLASLKSIGAYALVLVGVAAVVVLSALAIHPLRVRGASPHATAGSAGVEDSVAVAEMPSASTCSGFTSASVATPSLREAQSQARAFLDQQNPSEALTRFRSVAALDPGLPGIHLDLSTTLLKLHQTQSAKSAIDTQLSISECLSKLPSKTLDAYCRTQMSGSSAMGCRQELGSIERSAHFQSALVQMALANSLSGGRSPTPGGMETMPAAQAEPRPAARVVAANHSEALLAKPAASVRSQPSWQPKGPSVAKPAARNPLAGAEGTDAALGAYSK